jgi:hypothetical protein
MDIPLITTFFIALVFFVLAWNAALLWFVRRGISRAAERAAAREEQISRFIEDLKSGLDHLEAVSEKATEWSSAAREGARSLSDDFDRADNWVHYGLAKLDFNVDKVSERMDDNTQQIKSSIWEPLFRTATVVQGVKALLELVMIRKKHDGISPPAA